MVRGKNVLGTGWQSWNIAAFTTFLPCFVRMAANVLCGRDGDAMTYLTMTALDGEVRAMEQGLDTVVGRRSVWR